MLSNYALFDDIWFSGINTVEKASAQGVYCCGPVKTIQKVLFLAVLENLTKYYTGVYYLFMNMYPIVTCSVPLITIG